MVFVDASALSAILIGEITADALLDRLDEGGPFVTSPVAVYEAALAVVRASGSSVPDATRDVRDFLERARIDISPLPAESGMGALAAYVRFGKPHHRAKLNMGDCFAYATAKASKASILFVGDDFSHTDLPNALAGA